MFTVFKEIKHNLKIPDGNQRLLLKNTADVEKNEIKK